MSRKRRNTSSPESDYSPPPKKLRSIISYDVLDGEDDFEDPQNVREQSRLNIDSGLHNAFPGLGEDGDDLFYGPATDGIDYLRMVRSEAKAVPSLLVAQTNDIPDSGTQEEEYEEEEEETDFYFNDGTYIAIQSGSQNNPSLSSAQEQFYECLIEEFLSLRGILRRTPPLAAIQALGESRPITLPPNSKIARDAWERHILHCDPHPVQLASIDIESLLGILKLVGKKLKRLLHTGSAKTTSRVGLWAWSLLARCPDRGELVSEEISDVRALATRAADLLGTDDDPGISPVDEDADDGRDQDELDLAVREALMAKAQMLGNGVASDGDEAPDAPLASKKVIMNTIITIVGEVYGQRDLLSHREVWTSEQEALTGSVHHQLGE